MSPHTTININTLLSPPAKRKFFDLNNPTLILLFWDLFFGLPFSYTLTLLNKWVIQYMGYEKILRCPSGILGSRLLFASINVVLVVNWAVQLAEEARTDGVKREIAFWDGCIEVMEEQVERQGRKEIRQLEEQLTNKQRERDGAETVLVNGKDWNAKADSPKSMIPKVT